MEPACWRMPAMHASTLSWEQTSHVAVLMPSSESCFSISILRHAERKTEMTGPSHAGVSIS